MTKRRIEANGGIAPAKSYKRSRPLGTPLPLQQLPGQESSDQQPTFSYGESYGGIVGGMPSMPFPDLPALPLPPIPGGGLDGTLVGGIAANGYQSPYFHASESYSNPHPLAYSHAPLASTSAAAYDPFALPSPNRLDQGDIQVGAGGGAGVAENDDHRRMLELLATQALNFGPSAIDPALGQPGQGGGGREEDDDDDEDDEDDDGAESSSGSSSSSMGGQSNTSPLPLPHSALAGMQQGDGSARGQYQPGPLSAASAMPLQPFPFS